MKFASPVVVLSAITLLQGVQAEAQLPAKPLPETKVVLRISRQFIYQLTGKKFKRDEPIDKDASGGTIAGSAHVDGTYDVKLQESEIACDFDLLVNGEVLTQVVASSRPVQVHAHGVAAFSGRRRISFDGNAFAGQAIDMNVSYCSSIDSICSFRGGLLGALTRGIARPIVRGNLPESDRQAENEIHTRLTAAIEKDTDQLVATMNKVGPLLKKGEEALRKEKVLSASGVQRYLAATEHHLYMSVGSPGRRIPTLPTLDASKTGPVELWIAINKANKEDLLSPVLEHWNLIKPFVLARMAKRSPDLAKIIEHVQVESVEGWHVVLFAPQLLELAVHAEPLLR